eukprot:jgi/Chrzof1/11784/Cz06g10010.t1
MQGELDVYVCKLNGFQNAIHELEAQLAEKDLQVDMLKSVMKDEDPNSLQHQLLKALEDCQHLQARLQAAQKQTEDPDGLHLDDGGLAPPVKSASPVMKAGAVDQQQSQLVMLRKALAEANSRLSSAGLEPVALPSTTAAYQDYPLDPAGNMSHHHHYHQQCRASCGSSLSLPSEFPPSPEPHHSSTVWPAQASHDPIMSSSCGTASVEGPATPLSPPAKPCKTSILSIPDHAAGGPASSIGLDDGLCQPYHPYPCSPTSDISSHHNRSSISGLSAGPRKPKTCVNPLYRHTTESCRTTQEEASTKSYRYNADDTDAVNIHQHCNMAQAQLEIQLHQAQNQLSQLLHAGSVAHNQACSAHGRLRHSVKSLGKLYDLLKGVLEQWGTTNINKQALQGKVAHAIEDLAQLAKYQRELGSCIDAIRRLLHEFTDPTSNGTRSSINDVGVNKSSSWGAVAGAGFGHTTFPLDSVAN